VSHHKYQTEGFILGGFNVGESNRFLYVFTKEFGLVGASAQGVRELKSKLRYSLQDFSYSNVELVRGREVWRITNAENIHTSSCFTENIEKQKIFTNITTFIKRFFVGEGSQCGLFDDIVAGVTFLRDEDFTMEELKSFEVIMMLKILMHLGYFGEEDKFTIFLKKDNWNKGTLKQVVPIRTAAVCEINKAIDHSHL